MIKYYLSKMIKTSFTISLIPSVIFTFSGNQSMNSIIEVFIRIIMMNCIISSTIGFMIALLYNKHKFRNEKYLCFNCNISTIYLIVITFLISSILYSILFMILS